MDVQVLHGHLDAPVCMAGSGSAGLRACGRGWWAARCRWRPVDSGCASAQGPELLCISRACGFWSLEVQLCSAVGGPRAPVCWPQNSSSFSDVRVMSGGHHGDTVAVTYSRVASTLTCWERTCLLSLTQVQGLGKETREPLSPHPTPRFGKVFLLGKSL